MKNDTNPRNNKQKNQENWTPVIMKYKDGEEPILKKCHSQSSTKDKDNLGSSESSNSKTKKFIAKYHGKKQRWKIFKN